jgi:DNA-binding NarL/FixJ family response regulator
VSPRTVESHLQKVYQKLHVSSQIELMKVGLPVDLSEPD